MSKKPSENPKMMNYDDHDPDQSFAEKRLNSVIMGINNIGLGKGSSSSNHASSSSSNHASSSSQNPRSGKRNNVIRLKDFISNMGGSEPKFVVVKQLTRTDVSKSFGRFLIPDYEVITPEGFLTAYEERKLENKEDVSVWVFDPQGRASTLNIGQWKTMSGYSYVMKSGWNHVVSVNGFKENMVIKIVSFRVDHQLCFALVRA